MFTTEEIQAYYDFIRKPTGYLNGMVIDVAALYIVAVITLLIVLIVNLFRHKYSIWGYIVIFFTAFGGFALAAENLFPFDIEAIWSNAWKRIFIPFYDTYKYLYCMGAPVLALKDTVLYFSYYLFCPMCLSLGAHLLSGKKRVIYPWIITFAICLTELIMLFFDIDGPGDIGIFIVSAIGILLGGLIAKGIPQKIKSKLFRKEKELF